MKVRIKEKKRYRRGWENIAPGCREPQPVFYEPFMLDKLM